MKSLLLALAIFVSCPVWAEWVLVDGDYSYGHFVDPTTIRKEGHFRRAWILTNLKVRDRDGTLSRRARMEIDCKNERYKFLSMSGHSEVMAGGNITLDVTQPASTWIDIPPRTSGEGIKDFICSHK